MSEQKQTYSVAIREFWFISESYKSIRFSILMTKKIDIDVPFPESEVVFRKHLPKSRIKITSSGILLIEPWLKEKIQLDAYRVFGAPLDLKHSEYDSRMGEIMDYQDYISETKHHV